MKIKVTRTSPLTGQVNTIEVEATEQQIRDYNEGRGLIQDVFPNLTADEREFIKTGYTAEDWEKMFPPEGVDDDTEPFDEPF